MPSTFARLVAALTAFIAWAGLAIQLGLLMAQFDAQGLGPAAALWRFFGFFTILTNSAVALVATAMALRPQGRLAGPRSRMVTASAILLVGLVYSLALRHIWNPEGLQLVADHMLHDATPLLFGFTWLLFPHEGLGWRAGLWAAVPPLAYCLYAFARGAVDGWYAYYFLDPTQMTLGLLAGTMAMLLTGFIAAGMLFVAIDRMLARRSAA
ncbi:MAG: Pr6Pr family membrane protein [Parasphingopyxis sp.]